MTGLVSLLLSFIAFPVEFGYNDVDAIAVVIPVLLALYAYTIPFIAELLYLLFSWPDRYTMRVIQYWNLTISSFLVFIDLFVIWYLQQLY